MDKNIMMLAIIMNSLILLGILSRFYYALILILPVSLIYLSDYLKKEKFNDKLLLSLAKEIQRKYAKTRNVIKSIEQAKPKATSEKIFNLIARKAKLADVADFDCGSVNRHLKELIEILLFGISTGRNVGKNIELFVNHLEAEISRNNRINSKTSGINLLTYAGMTFFLPLFGGISASILSASLNLVNTGVQMLKERFLLIIDTYTSVILYINRFFGNPLESLLRRLYLVTPLSMVSTLVLFGVSGFATNML